VFLASRDNRHTAAEVDGRSRDDGDQEHKYCDTVNDEGDGPAMPQENVRIFNNQGGYEAMGFVLDTSLNERVEGKVAFHPLGILGVFFGECTVFVTRKRRWPCKGRRLDLGIRNLPEAEPRFRELDI